MSINSKGKDSTTYVIDESTHHVYDQCTSKRIRNKPWCVVNGVHVEELAPKDCRHSGVGGNEVNRERRLGQIVNRTVMEVRILEKCERAEPYKRDRQHPLVLP